MTRLVWGGGTKLMVDLALDFVLLPHSPYVSSSGKEDLLVKLELRLFFLILMHYYIKTRVE